ncbi:hypothetical protein GCM10007157_19210 [Vreelandella hamiltonii]|uniref:Uncharacterized protein n=1 Tax=Vreelandella hamiltonii TaxID=502829 RepID=A0A8H9LWF2_9GAMM|nr:hypothetical protein GCM10007157_19210 [Halomonas hamiltonii]
MCDVGGRFSARRSSHQSNDNASNNDNATNPVARRNEQSEAPAKHRNAVPIQPPKPITKQETTSARKDQTT